MNNPFAFLNYKYTAWKMIEIVAQEDKFQEKYHYGIFVRKNINTGMINFKRIRIINAKCEPIKCVDIVLIYKLVNSSDLMPLPID
jgi:hypothetical protein